MSTNQRKSSTWNHAPELPLQSMPYWYWPPRPWAVLRWLFENFLQVSDRALFLVYSFVIAFWLMPFVPAEAALSWDWATLVLLRNMVAVLMVVGGLHIWFYGIDVQGNVLRFDARPITGRKNALFLFGYQTWDNMFHTLVYGVAIASGFEIAIRWAYANGWTMPLSFSESPVWFVLLFPLLTLLQGIHFYLIHRLIHWPPLYRHVHSVHHRNVNVGPWSGLSMHPVEHLFYFSSLLNFFVLPAHPVYMMFLLHWQMLGAPTGHSGYEAVFARNKARILIGGFFHQLHHRYYECNYGSPEFPLDKWFGTYHDGTEEMTAVIRDRKRRMHAK
ncbi:sterol desaturase family protein [Ruegeria arenilitoris]|uniref:sterol desaturase family protein n=1 Tax=Ruegeria arenilitoris TaxID=1173585 RepID=UPI00148192EF|nr:sterol desaturase family protein [Ruegeria arenilitoris]